jgi:hypothetical protein
MKATLSSKALGWPGPRPPVHVVIARRGHLSFGNGDLDAWQARIAVSWLF